jgi:hypothetical protein
MINLVFLIITTNIIIQVFGIKMNPYDKNDKDNGYHSPRWRTNYRGIFF